MGKMCETSLSVWFVCRLCRGSFGQVDAFIEHKKQKHFTQFQNTTSIVFEESEHNPPYPVIVNGNLPLADQTNEPPIKIEVYEDDPVIPFSSEIIDEPNLNLVEVKSELIIYESQIIPESENNFLSLKQPQLNPYVLLKRLTADEIQRACLPPLHSTVLTCEQKNLANDSEPRNSLDPDSNPFDHNGVKKYRKIQQTANVSISTERNHQFECKLCSKQLESEAHLKIHVGICALYHKDRNRFCVTCNRKFCNTQILKHHRLRFHGTEEEKLSLYKFKCQLCPKKFREAIRLRFHMDSHNLKKQRVKTAKSKLLKCSHPNCGKEFGFNCDLQRHIATHLDMRPFSCSFPNCNKAFLRREYLKTHFRTHTGERPYKCTFDNCNKTFTISSVRSRHHRRVHCNSNAHRDN